MTGFWCCRALLRSTCSPISARPTGPDIDARRCARIAGWTRVATFNPGSNPNQVSRLRLANPGDEDAVVTVTGIDDTGASPVAR